MGILLKLSRKKRLTADFLAEEFEVSRRTVYRYVDMLSGAGVPLCTFNGKNGGIELDKNFLLPDTFFTVREIEYLINLISNDKKTQENSLIVSKLKTKYKII